MIYDIDYTKKAFDAAVRIDDKDTEYRVKGKEHLRLIVYNSKKALMVRHCLYGQRSVKKVGTYPMMKLSTFEKLANEIIEALESGGSYALALKATLNQFFNQIYLPTAKKIKQSWKDDESRYRLHIAPVLGEFKLAKIKSYHVQSMLNQLPEHLSDRTHDLIRALASVIFSHAIKYELLNKNPCMVIPARNNINVKERYMKEDECSAFIKSCLVEADIDSKTFSFQSLCLLLALLTGMRIGNCISVTRTMLSSDGSTIHLPKTKSGKPQVIFLSTQAQWVVRQALSASSSEYIFPSATNINTHIGRPCSTFIRVCVRAGIACAGSEHKVNSKFPTESLTIHCLRKTFATVLLNNFSTINAVSQLLGHANEGVTRKHYAFSNNEGLVKSVNSASSLMTSNSGFCPE